jgi:hypothetical protein
MYQVGYNNRDMISIGLGIVGVGLECVDAGLVIDLISVGVSAAGVYMDVTNPDFNK